MNDVDLLLLEQKNAEKLKNYGLDPESIQEFKSKLKVVSREEKTRLGKELYELISSRTYNDDKEYEKALQLIYNGADIEYKSDEKGDFVLLRCARRNYLKTFILLIKAGANINQTNNYLTTATMGSARHGNKEILEILILLKADINAKCKDGDTALKSARIHNQEECFYMLVNANANLTTQNQSNESIYTEPNNEKFESPLLKVSSTSIGTNQTSYEELENLLNEATEKMLEINNVQLPTTEANTYPVITNEQVEQSVKILSNNPKNI